MKLVPRVLLISLAALGMTGCRTFGTAPSPRLLPPPEPQTTFDVQEFVSEHNRNAELVESLEAKPKITARGGGRFEGGTPLTGGLVMERPRNFKLELRSERGFSKPSVADIGSNDSEFWFWVKNDNDKSIYVCNHDDLPSTPVGVSFQPDWIIDALGLRVIPPDEAAGIKARPGPDQTTELVFPPRSSNGRSSTRVISVSNQTRQITKHRLFAADNKTLLAQADITEYKPIDIPGEAGDAKETKSSATCLLPLNIKLDWKQEKFSLLVNLDAVVLNNFDPKQRDVVFVEPTIPGYTKVNLANSRGSSESRGETRIRESLPRMQRPIPEDDDTSSADDGTRGLSASQSRSRTTSRVERASTSQPLEAPIRSIGPQAPGSFDFQVADSLRADAAPPSIYER